MRPRSKAAIVPVLLFAAIGWTVCAQHPATADELKQAELDVPKLMPVLELAPGMAVADVGAGAGAMTLVMAQALGPSGHVYATDVNALQIDAIRDQAKARHLDNVVAILGMQTSTGLPDRCCDAIFVRDAYHHFTDPEAMNRSFAAALKTGGRLAIIDFGPGPGTAPPPNVPANRTGHGITSTIVEQELETAGFELVRTIPRWPPGDKTDEYFLVLARKK
jgi:ubiquinone/menaquinone biosynthesis C-methylase UbiE